MIDRLEHRVLFSAIVVNSDIDAIFPPESGIITLRYAIGVANQNSEPTDITFSETMTIIQKGTGFLITGTEPVSITGPSTIDGDAIGTIFTNNGDLTLSNISLQNSGAASIYNARSSTLGLYGVQIASNFTKITNFGTVFSSDAIASIRADLFDGNINSIGSDPNMGNGYIPVGDKVEIKYTLLGDTTLSGSVGFNDFMHMTQHFGQTNATWAEGDFNYDGVVDENDFLLLQSNYGQTFPQSPDIKTSVTDLTCLNKRKNDRVRKWTRLRLSSSF